MTLCILDAWNAEDSALINSHWVAERTAVALRREFPDVAIEVVAGDEVDATRVSVELERPYYLGFAYFGHGSQRALYRARDAERRPVPLVGINQLGLLKDRWFHAFACLSGDSLCHEAAHAGAAAYLGYRVTVILEWEESSLPEALRDVLATLVTVATLQLAHGDRSRASIRRRVRAASDQLVEWLEVHAEACAALHWWEVAGLYALASLLHREMVLEGRTVLE